MNDVISVASHPLLSQQWHPSRNELNPAEMRINSSMKAWWLDEFGHEWEAVIGSRMRGASCPFCSNKRVLEGFNDIATTHPEIAAEWHPERNDGLLPTQFTAGSNQKFWWKDEFGHEWFTPAAERKRGKNCPFCAGTTVLVGFNDLATTHPEIAAEWHPKRNPEVTVTEITAGSHRVVWWQDEHGHEWDLAVDQRVKKSNACPFCANKKVLAGFNDLATVRPDVAAQWHPTKNEVPPHEMLFNSYRTVWWLDEYGHEWETPVDNRTERNHGCPVCSGKAVVVGVNDLATTHPEIAAEWHTTLNEEVTAADVSANSKQKVWWLCPAGHEWQASPVQRLTTKKTCARCDRQNATIGVDDVQSQHPELVKEWHPKLNRVSAAEASVTSSKKYWWLGDCGHEWEATARSRIAGAGCLVCNNQQVIFGFNDFATTHPTLASQWHPTKNDNRTPATVTAAIQKKAWWLGECGHEWEASPYLRSIRNPNCPVCAQNINDEQKLNFAAQRPELAAQWHPTKNSNELPENHSIISDFLAWWECSQHHEWQATINDRNHGYSCPDCAAENILSGPQQEIHEFLTSLGLNVEKNNRTVLKNTLYTQLDFYVPEQKTGISFNGLYWHSEEQGKGRNYHHEKYLAAVQSGIQLIQIWGDDWNHRKNAVLRALAHKLGVTKKVQDMYPELAVPTETIYARKTQVVEISKKTAEEFLEANHIQGHSNGTYYLSLQDSNNLIRAVLVLKNEAGTEGKTLNIIRYATNGSVIGGFTKLLKWATKQYTPEDFITFADHTISDGGLYENNGFVADKILRPDYMYVANGEREHKFGYRLKRFRNDPSLLWDPALTERELALLNRIPRIWDAGKTRYRKTV